MNNCKKLLTIVFSLSIANVPIHGPGVSLPGTTSTATQPTTSTSTQSGISLPGTTSTATQPTTSTSTQSGISLPGSTSTATQPTTSTSTQPATQTVQSTTSTSTQPATQTVQSTTSTSTQPAPAATRVITKDTSKLLSDGEATRLLSALNSAYKRPDEVTTIKKAGLYSVMDYTKNPKNIYARDFSWWNSIQGKKLNQLSKQKLSKEKPTSDQDVITYYKKKYNL